MGDGEFEEIRRLINQGTSPSSSWAYSTLVSQPGKAGECLLVCIILGEPWVEGVM